MCLSVCGEDYGFLLMNGFNLKIVFALNESAEHVTDKIFSILLNLTHSQWAAKSISSIIFFYRVRCQKSALFSAVRSRSVTVNE